ncbi:Protein-ADP-ribose hydrolase [Penicillium rolfsii]|nr:Protein-ADP-ribose hydrolase [Penicillium rolfsii]
MSEIPCSSRLERVLRYLLEHQHQSPTHTECQCTHHHNPDWIFDADTWPQIETLRRLLCQRPALPKLPAHILRDIDAVLAYRDSHKLFTSTRSITPSITIQAQKPHHRSTRLSVWKGDITTLTDITAIVNAANSQLLGCFRPEHRCIDNVIHAAAGPRLRDACHDIVNSQGHIEPVGSAKVTPGYLLPAKYVLHTVGPQLHQKVEPQAHQQAQLASCYQSCLDEAENLPLLEDGRKVIAFCCISTGIFAFPSDMAAQIAVDTVLAWCASHPGSSITDIIFNTFLDKDWTLYQNLLGNIQISSPEPIIDRIIINTKHTPTKLPIPQQLCPKPHLSPALLKARTWLNEATTLIISAGAGLSAATGLDYTSPILFAKHFPAFLPKGLQKLYDVFGYTGWDSAAQKWGYYFTHIDMVRRWPESQCGVYHALRGLTERFGERWFVRTSNADGFFVKNGFDPARVATPQGGYRFLQCLAKCRPGAVVETGPLVDAGMPMIDPVSQVLMDEEMVPKCRFCGGEMTLCVRGGRYFDERPWQEMERKWEGFLAEQISSASSGSVVILELGVGLNTPSVLRWPNEDLVSESASRQFRLIRVGLEASGCVPWELEEDGLAVGVSGEIEAALGVLIS